MIHALFAVAVHLSSCNIAGAAARCGTLDVPESAGSSRTLHLKLIVFPATDHNVSPIFVFSGGPGIKSTDAAEMVAKFFGDERRLHDAVLLDLRGTEGSALCPNAVKAHLREAVEDDLFPPALVADCRKEVEAKADPTHFTSNDFADDVEAARIAVGYDKIDIVSLSYGTRFALTYQVRHPKSVRSIVMYGPLPAENRTPLNFARDAQTVMDRIAPLRDVMKVLAKFPVDVKSGGYTIHMTRGAFAEHLRNKLYAFDDQNKVPDILRQAAAGDWRTIAPDFINYRKLWYDDLGVFLSVTCSGDVRNISPDEIAPSIAGSFEGDYRVARQMLACAAWTPGVIPPLHVSNASAPILIFVGDRDGVTPKRWADLLASQMRPVRTIVLKNAGHGDFGADCASDFEVKFFDAGSYEKLPASCPQK
ncbi:MAG TPA: alpha/beta fold hydrolase [Thermoanaerobaculia bacterium]|nr:alpha/beta fold hydrolase [Thermoanaerobaculia bacterium]